MFQLFFHIMTQHSQSFTSHLKSVA